MTWQLISLRAHEVDRVEPLWRSMVEHHREVAGAEWPVRAPEEAWRRRREQYVAWLEGDDAWMLAADDGAELLGYAMLTVSGSGPTWDIERIGEIESLAVAPAARGRGIGTALLATCRDLLRERGVRHWSVSVVEANAGAMRMYERAGFRPFYRHLLGTLDDR